MRLSDRSLALIGAVVHAYAAALAILNGYESIGALCGAGFLICLGAAHLLDVRGPFEGC